MVFVFAVIGLAASVMALLGLAERRRHRAALPIHACALVLVTLAWWAGHLRAIGWVAVAAASGMELAVLVRRSVGNRLLAECGGSGKASESAVTSRAVDRPCDAADTGVGATAGADSAAVQVPPAPMAPPYTTCALLSAAWEPSAEVFLASLRRGGLREAETADRPASAGPMRLRVGSIVLELTPAAKPIPASEIDYAASQSWDWPDALSAVSGHAAHVLLTTRTSMNTPRREIVRLHSRAHAALAEFAPVVGVMWQDAGRLVPFSAPGDDATGSGEGAAPIAVCINFRMFPPSEASPDQFVSDSVGLHGFGLPDLQIATPAEPDETVSNVLYHLAERFFSDGCEIADGSEIDLAHLGRWRAARCRASFEPAREVIELSPVKPEAAEVSPETAAG